MRNGGAVFVTGANSGIGAATAAHLERAGFEVIRGARRPETLDGGGVTIDLADRDSVTRACAQVVDRAGDRLTAVVNNAGYTLSGACEVLDVDEWRDQFEVNLFGHIAVTRALLPHLLANHGRIVNVGSIGGRFSSPFLGPYSASKFAVHAWSDAMRMELAPHGVDVVLVEPGSIATPLWEKGQAAADEHLARMTPEQRTRYGDQINAARKAARDMEARGIPADRCAKVIVAALTSPRPQGRYLVGVDARLQAAISMLPARASDALTRAFLKLPKSS